MIEDEIELVNESVEAVSIAIKHLLRNLTQEGKHYFVDNLKEEMRGYLGNERMDRES